MIGPSRVEFRRYKECEHSPEVLQVIYLDHVSEAPEYVKAIQIWYDVPLYIMSKAKYDAHIKEGFTPEQALEICKIIKDN